MLGRCKPPGRSGIDAFKNGAHNHYELTYRKDVVLASRIVGHPSHVPSAHVIRTGALGTPSTPRSDGSRPSPKSVPVPFRQIIVSGNVCQDTYLTIRHTTEASLYAVELAPWRYAVLHKDAVAGASPSLPHRAGIVARESSLLGETPLHRRPEPSGDLNTVNATGIRIRRAPV
jgi:hypothetical protein